MKILVVDDEQDMQNLFQQKFRKEIRDGQVDFAFAISGETALEYLNANHHEAVLILSDINMPGMSGCTSRRCPTASAGTPAPAPIRCVPSAPPEIAGHLAKLLELPYSVEGERGAEPREATIEVSIAEDARGVPLEASIGGPDLFLRLEETHRVKPVTPGDTAQRAAAITRVVDLVKAAFAARVSADPACRRRPSPPAVLDLACNGVSVTVTAAAAPGEDDRVVISPFQP